MSAQTSPDSDAAWAAAADLGWALAVVSRALRERAAEAAADLPAGPRGYLVLATIAQGRPRTQLALAQQLGLDKTVMTYLLDALEEGGLLERRPDPADRRARQVSITAAGRRAVECFGVRIRAAEDELLASLSGTDSAALRTTLDRVARSLQGDESRNAVCVQDFDAGSAG